LRGSGVLPSPRHHESRPIARASSATPMVPGVQNPEGAQRRAVHDFVRWGSGWRIVRIKRWGETLGLRRKRVAGPKGSRWIARSAPWFTAHPRERTRARVTASGIDRVGAGSPGAGAPAVYPAWFGTGRGAGAKAQWPRTLATCYEPRGGERRGDGRRARGSAGLVRALGWGGPRRAAAQRTPGGGGTVGVAAHGALARHIPAPSTRQNRSAPLRSTG